MRFIQRIILLGMTFAAQALQHTEKPRSLLCALIQYPAIPQYLQWIFKLQQIQKSLAGEITAAAQKF